MKEKQSAWLLAKTHGTTLARVGQLFGCTLGNLSHKFKTKPMQLELICRGVADYDRKPEETGSVSCEMIGDDPRYQILIVSGEFGNHGYTVDQESGELRRVCICHARSASECCCGAWDETFE